MSEEKERDYTTVSIPLNIASKIDEALKNSGHINRTDFVRDAVRTYLKTFEGV